MHITLFSAQELCESRGGRPDSPYGLCGRKATLNCSIDLRAQEVCESGGGRPGLPVPNNPYGLCGRKATLNCIINHFYIALFSALEQTHCARM